MTVIIIGYPGVGKSFACGKDSIIDLESTLFYSGYANNTWVKPYVSVAVDLHLQGYTVCISSHEAVRNMLRGRGWLGVNLSTDVAMIYPDQSLKDAWIERLKNRYYASKKYKDVPWVIGKNYRAWQQAIDHYDIDIYDMSNCDEFAKYVITDLNSYDIRVAINSLIQESERVKGYSKTDD